MKQCRHCGFFNPDDNQFCVNCGKTLDGPAHKGGFPVKAVLIILLSIAVIGLVVLFIRKPSWLPFGTKTVGLENDTEKEPFPETADPGDSPGETEIGEDNDDPAIDPETDEDPDAPFAEPETDDFAQTVDVSDPVSEAGDEAGESSDADTPVYIAWHDADLEEAVRGQTNFVWPMTVEEAGRVRYLDLTDCDIRDIQDLRYFEGLRELKMGKNMISDISALANMPKLEVLNIEMNEVMEITPLANLYGLKKLDLYDNLIEDVSPLSGHTELTMLDLRNNMIQDISSLRDMTDMEELYLSDNQISDISAIEYMYDLTYFSVKNNPVKDISALAGKNRLDTLVIAGTNVSDIAIVETLPELGYLDIRRCPINDYSVTARLKKQRKIKIEQ